MPTYYEEWKELEEKLSLELADLVEMNQKEITQANIDAIKKIVNKLRNVRKTLAKMEGK